MKRIVTILLLCTAAFVVKAQEKDPVLLTVGGKDVKLSEFNAIFNKNKTDEKVTPESVKEYLDLYVKFKLKVREAEALGYDTLPKFQKELAGYRKQLAKPYLTDKKVTEVLIKEAYDRMKYDVRASHILIKLDADAFDNDTIEAYKKAMTVRKRIVKGEDFAKVAKEVSADPSAKNNGGDLGYFSALHMVYPFESAAYNTPVGEVSKPVRTKFGYHIIKVTGKRPARGTIKVAHIMVKSTNNTAKAIDSEGKKVESRNKNASADVQKQKIYEIYEKVKAGEDFAMLAKQYSDDKNSSRRGGELPEFNAGKMVPQFEEMAFSLKNDGDVSEPFLTQYGWHIVKRLNLKELAPYDDMYDAIKSKVSRDSRSNKSKKVLLTKIKTENNFKESIKERNDFYRLITAKEMKEGWDLTKANKYNAVMFGYYAPDGDEREFTQTQFAELLAKLKVPGKEEDINVKAEINKLYKQQVYKEGLDFKDSRLSKTNEEFRLLMKEYRDGILLFDLTDEKVWSKAVKDSVGLEAFYEKNKTNYMWDKRVDVTLYVCKDETVSKQVSKILKKKTKKGYSNDDILNMVNEDSQLNLNIEEGKFSRGDNYSVDQATWTAGTTSTVKSDKGVTLVVINQVLDPEPKALDEIRGLITSDYQNHLEQEWIKELQTKYDVKVNEEVLKLVK